MYARYWTHAICGGKWEKGPAEKCGAIAGNDSL